ncbi:hypothetical protein Pan14r_17580 [Crateriforma conspicua]|uniref:Uncharacterized protein n=1 Tax=Crateriforma conspicua TaxID=2527996 RepID=A0A5C5Y4A9_9PLAN|nr:hypothetical protein Pan14r_17580 [Crateriforma conspicua]
MAERIDAGETNQRLVRFLGAGSAEGLSTRPRPLCVCQFQPWDGVAEPAIQQSFCAGEASGRGGRIDRKVGSGPPAEDIGATFRTQTGRENGPSGRKIRLHERSQRRILFDGPGVGRR